MARPSASVAVRISAETVMPVAGDTSISTVEVVMPSSHECFPVLFDDSLHTAQFCFCKSTMLLQRYRVQPEFG